MQTPYTSSPGLNLVTLLLTASTLPAMSLPILGSFGLRNPLLRVTTIRSRRFGPPVISYRSAGFTEDAWIFTSTPRTSSGAGFSSSLIWRTSGEPYRSRTTAFMSVDDFSSFCIVTVESIIFRQNLLCRSQHLNQIYGGLLHHILHLLLGSIRKEGAQVVG